jgi:hypothetical protein
MPSLGLRPHPCVLERGRLPPTIPTHHDKRLPRQPTAFHPLLPWVRHRAGPVHHRGARGDEANGLKLTLEPAVLQHRVK